VTEEIDITSEATEIGSVITFHTISMNTEKGKNECLGNILELKTNRAHTTNRTQ